MLFERNRADYIRNQMGSLLLDKKGTKNDAIWFSTATYINIAEGVFRQKFTKFFDQVLPNFAM